MNSLVDSRWRLPIYVTALIIAAVLLLVWLDYAGKEPQAVNVWIPAKVAKAVKLIPKVSIPIKHIKVYAPKAKAQLKLPDNVLDDPIKQVLEASTVERSEHQQTVTTVLNTDTGETETITRQEPLPWVQLDDRGSIGMYSGIKNGQPTVRLEAHEDVFDIKSVRCGAVASVDQPITTGSTEYFAGIGCAYHW